MQYNNLLTELENQLLIVTINRPSALNALNVQTKEELKHLFTVYIPQHDTIKAVILTGAGEKAFVAGADIKYFETFTTESAAAFSKLGHETFDAIERLHTPVVAAVNGYALGGGCELAMACHVRIASEQAKFGQPEVNLGILPGYGGTQRLPQLIGKGRAIDMMLTGKLIDASTALAYGLVSAVVPAKNLIETAKKYLQQVLTKSPLAIKATLDSVLAGYDEGTNGYQKEIKEFGLLSNTEDFKEGVDAFINKRQANFKGK